MPHRFHPRMHAPERTEVPTSGASKNSTTSFLTATTLIYAIGAGITAAAGTCRFKARDKNKQERGKERVQDIVRFAPIIIHSPNFKPVTSVVIILFDNLPDLPSNWSSIRNLDCSHSNCQTYKGPALLFIVTTSLFQYWVIYAPAAFLGCGSRLSGSLSGIEP